MAKGKWKFADVPGSKDRLKPHADEWIANALSTARITEYDAIVQHINGLYAAADLPPPRDVIFVQSPFVAAIAGMISAGALHLRKQGVDETALRSAIGEACRLACDPAAPKPYAATYAAMDDATDAATDAATRAATDAATGAATHAATHAATRAATHAATYAATDDATRAATDAATRAATDAATYAATYAATRAATYAATGAATHAATYAKSDDKLVAFLLGCIQQWYGSYDGGSDWSAWCSYLSFGRVIGRTDVDYSKWIHYERLAQLCGPRILRPTFVIVSERPSVMQYEMRDRHAVLHGIKQWSDGWTLTFVDGQRTAMTFEPTLPRSVVTYRDGVKQPPRIDDAIAAKWAEVVQDRAASAEEQALAEEQAFAWQGLELPKLAMTEVA